MSVWKLEERSEEKGLETGFRGKERRRFVMAKAMYRRRGQEVESKEGRKWNVETRES